MKAQQIATIFIAIVGTIAVLILLFTAPVQDSSPKQIRCYADGVLVYQRTSKGAVDRNLEGLRFTDALTGQRVGIQGYECLTMPVEGAE